MEARWAVLLVLFLLSLQIQPVRCQQEPAPPCNNFTLDSAKDPCENTTMVCSRMVSTKDKLVPWLSFTMSLVILFCPFLRIRELRRNERSDAQTFFWWFLFAGFLDYILWICYFWKCFDSKYSAYPVLLACGFGGGIHLLLLIIATVMTWNAGDQRFEYGYTITISVIIVGGILQRYQRQLLGWMGVTLSVYYARFNWFLFVASMVGSVNGFLWLIHPQLCISKEYKIGSYIIGCLRGLETFLWLRRLIAEKLSRIEGEVIVLPARIVPPAENEPRHLL